MSEKAKNENGQAGKLSPLNFLLLWVAFATTANYFQAVVMNWLFSFDFIQNWVLRNFSYSQFLLLIVAVLVSGGAALIKKHILRMSFGRTINGWVWASILGTVLLYAPMLIGSPRSSTLPDYLLKGLLAILPIAWVLRRYVRHIWMLIISNVWAAFVSFVLFDYIMKSSAYPSDLISLGVGTAFPAVVMALNLLWFFRGTYLGQESQKTKNVDSSCLEDCLDDNLNSEELGVAQAEAQS